MKNKLNNVAKLGMLLGLITITPLCIAQPAASANSSHGGGGSHGGGSGGGGGGGMPYPTASTVSQLVADITYANKTGGAITINLAPGATFSMTSANNTTDGNNGLPVVGGTIPVNLTITGNGDTIERIQVIGKYYTIKNPFRLFDVAAGATLTLDKVTIKGGTGGILNHGTLNVINGSLLSSNSDCAIYNNGGTVTVSDSTLSGNSSSGSGGGIYNAGGTVTLNNGTLSGNAAYYGGGIFNAGGTVTVNASAISCAARFGGGIYNAGGTVTVSTSSVSGSAAYHADYPWEGGNGGGIYNSGTLTISHSNVSNNSADPYFGSGGGIYNDVNGAATVENSSNVIGNTASDASADVQNSGALYLDNSSTIGILSGNPANPI